MGHRGQKKMMTPKKMSYCMFCGTKLHDRKLQGEGMIPWCDTCKEYRFPVFSTAVSMIVTNQENDRILLIKQYGRKAYVLVAGYVNKGEDAEAAVSREIREELGLTVLKSSFNHSRYFKPSNTLMLNFTAVVSDQETPQPNGEIDDWAWLSVEEARQGILENSLAEEFLFGYLEGEYHFRTPSDDLN